MTKVTRYMANECKRCGHQWIPRISSMALACPRCKQYDWNKEVEEDEEDDKTS